MADADFSRMLDILRKMQGQLSSIVLELGDIKGRLTLLEEASSSMSARIAALGVAAAGTNKRLDRYEHRLERIETRLGLIDA